MGFCLTGLGGVIALECTMDEQVLREAVYAGTLGTLLFPDDVVANAPAILAQLDRAFPPQQGSYVFGALARIAWGSGIPVFRADLAILMEFGRNLRVALAGLARIVLPDPTTELVRIQLQILGFIDFDEKTLSIDAALTNSHLAKYELEGEAALRSAWGEHPRFAFSAGGFHPAYAPPAGFPALKRMAIILSRGNPNIGLFSYLAVTENSFQFGSQLQFYWRKNVDLWLTTIKVEVSGSAGFDVLLTFNPFHFVASVYACFDLKVDGDSWLALNLDLTVEGPNRYHVQGRAEVSICKISVEVSVDHYFGEKTPEPPLLCDPVALLRAELQNPANWTPRSRTGYAAGVLLREVSASGEQVHKLDPFADRLEFAQAAVPLRSDDGSPAITRVGTALVEGAKSYDLRFATLDGVAIGKEKQGKLLRKQFAPGQFFEVDERAKLDGAFELHKAGGELLTDALEFPSGCLEELPPHEYKRHFKLNKAPATQQAKTSRLPFERLEPTLRRAAVRRYTHEPMRLGTKSARSAGGSGVDS